MSASPPKRPASRLLAVGDALTATIAQAMRGLLALEQGAVGDARRDLEGAIQRSRDPSYLMTLGIATAGLALTASRCGEMKRAWDLAQDALDVCAVHGFTVGSELALEVVAVVASQTDRAQLAARLGARRRRGEQSSGCCLHRCAARSAPPYGRR